MTSRVIVASCTYANGTFLDEGTVFPDGRIDHLCTLQGIGCVIALLVPGEPEDAEKGPAFVEEQRFGQHSAHHLRQLVDVNEHLLHLLAMIVGLRLFVGQIQIDEGDRHPTQFREIVQRLFAFDALIDATK